MIQTINNNAVPASMAVLIGDRVGELVTTEEREHLKEAAEEWEALQAELDKHGWDAGRADYKTLAVKFEAEGKLTDLKRAELKERCTEKHTVQRRLVKQRARKHYVDLVREPLAKVYERATSIVADRVKALEADARKAAQMLALPYIEPPIVESAKRSLNILADAARLTLRSQSPVNIRATMGGLGVTL